MTLGLLFTALGLGLRHGIDWDHIAAISDLTGSSESRRQGWWLSLWYALGHAAAVFVLGVAAIAAGSAIPEGLDVWMGRFVGVTLVILGVWLLVDLVRRRDDFRLRSRWMLVIDGTFRGLRRVRSRQGRREIAIDHEHAHDHDGEIAHGERAAHDHAHDRAHVHPDDHAHVHPDAGDVSVGEPGPESESAALAEDQVVASAASAASGSVVSRRWFGLGRGGPRSPELARRRSHRHSHRHTHAMTLPDAAGTGRGAAAGIGVVHGIGIESPTQIAIFVASTAAVGTTAGIALLGAWVLGLVIANSALAVVAGWALLQPERAAVVHRVLALVVGVSSIGLGLLYILAG